MKFSEILRLGLAVLAVLTATQCSSHGGSYNPGGLVPGTGTNGQSVSLGKGAALPTSAPVAPKDASMGDRPGSRLSSSSSPLSFASMTGKDLHLADIDRFIDPSVTGEDKTLAEKLLASQPKNIRGDFVYIRKDGSMLSNRPALIQQLKRESFTLPGEPATSSIRPQSITPSQGADIGNGPYIRELSLPGLTALIATVTLVCNDEALAIDPLSGRPDTGYAYSGGTGVDGSGVDAGLQYNPDGSIQPFISYSVGAQWTAQYQRYYCDTQAPGNYGTLGIFYGEMTSGNMLFLATGVPENPPSQTSEWPNGYTGNWDDSAYVYFDTPGNWYQPGTDAVGQPTVCASCTVKRITSIAQIPPEDFFDGSCFGACTEDPTSGYYAGLHWGSIVMGQIGNPCPVDPGASSTTCWIYGYEDGRWFGSLVDFSGSNSGAIHIADDETTYASEGIDLDPGTQSISPDANVTYTCSY